MGGVYTSFVDERLRAQLEYLRSDDRLRELAAVAGEMAPEERLEQAWAMAASAAATLEALGPEARARIEATRQGPNAGAAPVLRRLARLASPEGREPGG